MEAMISSVSILGLLIVGAGILILALMMFFSLAEQRPPLSQLAARICEELLKAFIRIIKGFDQGANEAGRSLGGIYGKPAAQALTPDNQTASFTIRPFFAIKKSLVFRRSAQGSEVGADCGGGSVVLFSNV